MQKAEVGQRDDRRRDHRTQGGEGTSKVQSQTKCSRSRLGRPGDSRQFVRQLPGINRTGDYTDGASVMGGVEVLPLSTENELTFNEKGSLQDSRGNPIDGSLARGCTNER